MQPILFLGLTLLAQPAIGTAPAPRPVIVELRNGSRIEGDFIEEDGKFTVVRVAGGEIRFPTKTILRLLDRAHQGDAAGVQAPGGKPEPAGRVRHELPAPGAVSFEVPDAWTETKLPGRDLGLTDPTQSIFFGVSSVSDAHSLWNLTAAIKKEYGKLYPDFALEREKYRVLASIRSWEIEFRYTKEKKLFREIQLVLDFGDAKRIFAFTTAAERFAELAPRFHGVTESFQFPAAAPGKTSGSKPEPAGELPRDAAPGREKPGAKEETAVPRRARGGDGVPLEPLKIDLERLLPVDPDPPVVDAESES